MLAEETLTVLSLDSLESYLNLFGANERNVPLLENELGVNLAVRGSELRILGQAENVNWAVAVVEKLKAMAARHATVDRTTLRYAAALVRQGN